MRQFPRFLFSTTEGKKSKGPFIIHAIHPRKLFTVHWNDSDRGFFLHEIQDWTEEYSHLDFKPGDIIRDAEKWLSGQLGCGNIIKPDTE
jgi:Zn/Cd-binding protein ZinT